MALTQMKGAATGGLAINMRGQGEAGASPFPPFTICLLSETPKDLSHAQQYLEAKAVAGLLWNSDGERPDLG